MRELRELICQSRLDYYPSDHSDFEDDGLSDSGAMGDMQMLQSCSKSADFFSATTPDSGLASSFRQCLNTSDSDCSKKASTNTKSSTVFSRSKAPTNPSASVDSPRIHCTTEDFAMIFDSIDRNIVARWLEDSNAVIAQLSHWCHCHDNFVAFGHFWLSKLPGIERNSLIRMEHDIFVDRLSSIFLASSNIRLHHVTALAGAVLHEFPRRLLSLNGPRLVLHWFDVLTSTKRCEQFRKMFASVHCSTTRHQHSEIVLSLRAFALVSLVSAFVDFYQKLLDNDVHRRTDEHFNSAREDNGGQLSVSERRICTSVRHVLSRSLLFVLCCLKDKPSWISL